MKKILILSANPINTGRLRLEEEVREIRLALERAPKREAFQLIHIGAVRIDDLHRTLFNNEPQIVHFSGHGTGTDGLVLENTSGEPQRVNTEALSNLFELFKEQIECVVLNACYSEIQAEALHRHIDCVIGMGQPIHDREAINFSKGFYDAIFSGRNYADAFKFGRNNIDLNNTSSFNTPTITPVIKLRDKFFIPELRQEKDIKQILLDHYQNINILRPGISGSENITSTFDSNEGFWLSILNEQTRALNRVNLNKFQILNWYPRSPGLFHTKEAQHNREQALQSATKEKGVLVYPPDGKYSMIQGGIGSIRFKTRKIKGEECWLCTATSDGYCHSGIPLVIPNRLVDNIDFNFNSGIYFFLSGQVIFLDDFLRNKFFPHLLGVPLIYILVKKISKIDIDPTPTYITPMVFFESYENRHSSENIYKVTYITCQPIPKGIRDAIKWMKQYVKKYSGTIITDFDEQIQRFSNTKITLRDVMQGSASMEQLSSLPQYRRNDVNDIENSYQLAKQQLQELGILPTQNQ